MLAYYAATIFKKLTALEQECPAFAAATRSSDRRPASSSVQTSPLVERWSKANLLFALLFLKINILQNLESGLINNMKFGEECRCTFSAGSVASCRTDVGFRNSIGEVSSTSSGR